MARPKREVQLDFGFDIAEWISFKLKEKREARKTPLDEKAIRVRLKRSPKNHNKMLISFTFGDRILKALRVEGGQKVAVCHHRDSSSRIIFFRSENGYKFNVPRKDKSYYYIKFSTTALQSFEEGVADIVPLCHPKGGNSAPCVELELREIRK